MTRRYLIASFTVLLLALGSTTVHAARKPRIEICHVQPRNQANFRTIKIKKKAMKRHLAHGDFLGSCFENAEALCDDGDRCTVDGMDPETETCLEDPPLVECNDGNLCTTDTCNPVQGCQSAPVVCEDGDNCTADACNPTDGQCTFTPMDCGPLGTCLPEVGQCDYPCEGFTCDPIDQCHEAGICVLSGWSGQCLDGAPLADGTACDDDDVSTTDDQCTGGVCAGTETQTAGQFQIEGIEYVLEKISTIPETSETLGVVGPLVEDYAASVGQPFPHAILSSLDLFFPLDPHLFIDQEIAPHISPEFTGYLHLTVDAIQTHIPDGATVDLAGLNAELDQLSTSAQQDLQGMIALPGTSAVSEYEIYLVAVDVTRYSSMFWVDPSQGGLGGLNHLSGIIGWDASLQFTIPWGIVISFGVIAVVYAVVLIIWIPLFGFFWIWIAIFVSIFISVWILFRYLWLYTWLWSFL